MLLVDEGTCGCGVVKGATACEIRPSSHLECGIGKIWLGFEKHVCGLARGYEECVCVKWFGVFGIRFNHS